MNAALNANSNYSEYRSNVHFCRAGFARRIKLSGAARPTDCFTLEIELELLREAGPRPCDRRRDLLRRGAAAMVAAGE